MTTHPPQAQANGVAGIAAAMPVAAPLAYATDAEEREIPVELIDDDDNARKHFDKEQVQALAGTIHEHGLIDALIVYPHLQSQRYKLIAGGLRLRAIQLLGWKTARARVLRKPPSDAERSELSLISNDQHHDISNLERGLAYASYIKRQNATATSLAKKIGRSVSFVTRCIQLAERLAPDLHTRVQDGTLPSTVAQELLPLPHEDQRAIAREYPGQLKTGADVTAAVKAAKNGQAAGTTAGFTAEENGVRISITWTTGAPGANPEQPMAAVENALKTVLKDLREHGHRGVERLREFLSKKVRAAKKAAELAEANDALAKHASPDTKGEI